MLGQTALARSGQQILTEYTIENTVGTRAVKQYVLLDSAQGTIQTEGVKVHPGKYVIGGKSPIVFHTFYHKVQNLRKEKVCCQQKLTFFVN